MTPFPRIWFCVELKDRAMCEEDAPKRRDFLDECGIVRIGQSGDISLDFTSMESDVQHTAEY